MSNIWNWIKRRLNPPTMLEQAGYLQLSLICTKCRQVLPKEDFYRCKKSPTGLQYWCKKCCKQYKHDNPEKTAMHHRRYRETHQEQIRTYKARYYAMRHADQTSSLR